MGEREVDVVVIGAGAPGEVIAGRLGELLRPAGFRGVERRPSPADPP